LSIADLQEINDEVDEERAAELIMTARAPWFEDSEPEEAPVGDAHG